MSLVKSGHIHSGQKNMKRYQNFKPLLCKIEKIEIHSVVGEISCHEVEDKKNFFFQKSKKSIDRSLFSK
jgi:hypothetical protein